MFREADMYEPVKALLEKQNYEVHGEVGYCDVVARDGEQVIVVEMKKHFSSDLLMQALKRQKLTEHVYVAIPRPKRTSGEHYKGMLELCKRLEIGLILVALDSPVQYAQIVLFPGGSVANKITKIGKRKREALKKEMNGRTSDQNRGGSTRTKLSTAYREKCIYIACVLAAYGAQSPADLRNLYGCDKTAASILSSNYYMWFTRVEKGIYALSEVGMEMLQNPDFPELVEYYREKARSTLVDNNSLL